MNEREAAYSDVIARIDAITETARQRREQATDESIKALRPSEVEWMTSGELAELDRLQLERIRLEPTTQEIRARVAAKRAARLRAQWE